MQQHALAACLTIHVPGVRLCMVQVWRGRSCLGHLPAPGCAPAAGLPHGPLLGVPPCRQTTEAQRHQACHTFPGHTSAGPVPFLHVPSNNTAATMLCMVKSLGFAVALLAMMAVLCTNAGILPEQQAPAAAEEGVWCAALAL